MVKYCFGKIALRKHRLQFLRDALTGKLAVLKGIGLARSRAERKHRIITPGEAVIWHVMFYGQTQLRDIWCIFRFFLIPCVIGVDVSAIVNGHAAKIRQPAQKQPERNPGDKQNSSPMRQPGGLRVGREKRACNGMIYRVARITLFPVKNRAALLRAIKK